MAGSSARSSSGPQGAPTSLEPWKEYTRFRGESQGQSRELSACSVVRALSGSRDLDRSPHSRAFACHGQSMPAFTGEVKGVSSEALEVFDARREPRRAPAPGQVAADKVNVPQPRAERDHKMVTRNHEKVIVFFPRSGSFLLDTFDAKRPRAPPQPGGPCLFGMTTSGGGGLKTFLRSNALDLSG